MTRAFLRRGLEFPLQLGPVRLFHDEDDVGPRDQFVRQRTVGIAIGAGRCDFDVASRRRNTCSAVGLRRRFWLQTKRTFFMTGLTAPNRPTTASSTDHARRRGAQAGIADRRDEPLSLQHRQPRGREASCPTERLVAREVDALRPAAGPSAGTRRPLPSASSISPPVTLWPSRLDQVQPRSPASSRRPSRRGARARRSGHARRGRCRHIRRSASRSGCGGFPRRASHGWRFRRPAGRAPPSQLASAS